MKRAEPQPRTSTTEHYCAVLFTLKKNKDSLVAIGQLEEDKDCPECDLEYVSDNINLEGPVILVVKKKWFLEQLSEGVSPL